jgi:uncharacterized protein (TIGR02117 family)
MFFLAKQTIMKIIKKLLKYITIFILSLVTYLLVVTLLSFVSVNKDLVKNQEEIPVYILSNGVHTDIVVPVKNEIHDWSQKIKFTDVKAQNQDYEYIAFGWGDKGFYLDTPTWSDLKTSTALKAVSGFNSTAMHVTFYTKLQENENCIKLFVSQSSYKKLIRFIQDSFQLENDNFSKIETNAVYGLHDAFYEAKGRYSLFYTCNTWANQALKAANKKAALWTIFDFGIFQHYK